MLSRRRGRVVRLGLVVMDLKGRLGAIESALLRWMNMVMR
jgi:hypothetical protein